MIQHSNRSHHLARPTSLLLTALAALIMAGCASSPSRTASRPPSTPASSQGAIIERSYFSLPDDSHAREVVIYAIGLMDTGYRFGGRNPEAGLDCSGMVSFIVEQISGQRLPHNAAQIADQTRPIGSDAMQPGDLVFFNTMHRPYSHMGIYIGEGRFIHAPNSRGKVRIDRIDNSYFSQRLDGVRTLVARRTVD